MSAERPNPASGGDAKVDEYVARIQAGESLERILDDLPPSFRKGVEAKLRISSDSPEIATQEPQVPAEVPVTAEDEKKLQEIKERLGIVESKAAHISTDEALKEAEGYLRARGERTGKVQAYEDLYKDLEKRNNSGEIAAILAQKTYHELRDAEYPIPPRYGDAWAKATTDETLPHREQGGWIYRGNFPRGESHSETRGSLNVEVSPQLVDELDSLIRSGVIDANYKFGQADTGAAADSRHDAITIYFNSLPSEEARTAVADIAKRYYRGNTLLGEKVSDGFFMSEIGSVTSQAIEGLLAKLNVMDPELQSGIRSYLTKDKRLAMSEAQYYAVKEALHPFGIEITYDQEQGFKLD
jgi:hypothetical protein